MITTISQSKKIKTLQHEFQLALARDFSEEIQGRVGHPSGSFQGTMRYSPKFDIWITTKKEGNRFWNGFGVGKPRQGKGHSLTGEINFPQENIQRAIAGVFGIDNNKTILVLHRGRLGGGRKGITKEFFRNHYMGDYVTAMDGDVEKEFFLVGELHSPNFGMQVAAFINEIKRIKELKQRSKKNKFDFLNSFKFSEESLGLYSTRETKGRIVNRVHGIVQRALAKELKNIGCEIANDCYRDLFVYENQQIKTLFEIKSTISTQSLYAAVGQLIVYSIPIKTPVKLVMVLPDKPTKEVIERLTQVKITLLYYRWKDGRPIFENLEKYKGSVK